MARDLVLDVVARKNSRDLSTLADEFDRLAKQTDDAGLSMQKTTTFSKFLDEELVKTKAKAAELGAEFERTGNKDVFGALRGTQANIRSLERIKSDLTKALEDGAKAAAPGIGSALAGGDKGGGIGAVLKNVIGAAQGAKAGEVFKDGFVGALGEIASAAAPVLIPTAIVLGTLIAGAVGGGVLAASGVGLIAAGIIGQLQDPEVHAAATDLGGFVKNSLKDATSGFKAPLASAFGILKTELAGPLADLKNDFASVTPYIDNFAVYLGAAAEKFMPGFNRAIQASGPILGMLARELPTIANAANIFFDEVSKGSKGGTEALDTLIKGFSMLVAGLGFAVRGAENVWDAFIQIVDKGTGILAKLGGWIPGVGSALQDLHGYVHGIATSFQDGADSAGAFGGGMGDAAVAADSLADAVHKMSDEFDTAFGKLMSLDTANAKFKEDLLGMKAALDQHSHSLSSNSLAGLHNQDVVRGMIQDAEDARKAFIDQAGGANASQAAIDQANAAYENAIQQIITMGVKAGLSKDQLQALVGQYDINLVYTTTYVSRGTPPTHLDYGSIPTGRIGGVAHGGWIHGYAGGGNVFEVGEMGPEYLSIDPGSAPMYVTPNSVINGAANSTGRTSVGVTVDFAGTSRTGSLDSVLETWFMERVRAGRIKVKLSQLAA